MAVKWRCCIVKKIRGTFISQTVLNAPNEIWVAGKGPSLDTFNWSKAGIYRVGINETAFLIPRCTVALALDTLVLHKYKDDLDENITVCVRDRKKFRFKNQHSWTRNEVKHHFGSLNVALQLFYNHGVRIFHLVGCDSVDGISGYAKMIQEINAEGRNKDGYRRINRKLKQVMEGLKDAKFIFEHRSMGGR